MATYNQIIQQGMGMDHYWQVIHSASDDGLEPYELEWKRDYERSMVRMEEKFGYAYREFFENNR